MIRRLGVLLVALFLALLSAPPAIAIDPPAIDPGALPPDETGPDQPTEQRRVCGAPTVFPNSNFADKPWPSEYLQLPEAQKFATGEGVTVAVIDTGVNASPRVPAEPGGDFVDKAGNGLSDCDAHGTLTASIIAGRPAPTDGFIGVAPQARLVSLRQTSDNFQPVGSRSDPNDPNTTQTAGSLRSLARAIVHAANIGAQVINISEAACYKVTRPIDESSLGAAIEYAVNVKNSVIVVAAGNTGQEYNDLPSGERRWLSVSSRRLNPSDGDRSAVLITLHDVTAVHTATERLAHQARHDPLTGLPNRTHLIARAEQLLADAKLGAVLFLDLDDFKKVNDTLGHDAGDAVIRIAAQRIRDAVRDEDVVCRLAGDEFVVLAVGAVTVADTAALTDRVITALSAPIDVADASVCVMGSVGVVATMVGEHRDAATLLRQADVAMYAAKARGRRAVTFGRDCAD